MNNEKISKYLKSFKQNHLKTIIITGANSGLGYSATKHFLSLGVEVVMACRNIDKANKARHALLNLYPKGNVEIIEYDQADFKSIDRFVNQINLKYPDFDGLILNAGIYHPKKGLKTKQRYPLTIGTNFVGIFYLLKKLNASNIFNILKDRRIVFIGSLSWHKVKLSQLKSIFFKDALFHITAYARSKTLLGTLAYQLSRHESHEDLYLPKHVKVLMMHPGVTSTNIVGSSESSYPRWFSTLAQKALNLFVHHADQAALGIVKLALDLEVNENKIVVPRGIFHISGYPTEKRYPKNLKIMNRSLIDISNQLISRNQD